MEDETSFQERNTLILTNHASGYRGNCSTFKSTTYSSETTCQRVACVITNYRSGLEAATMGEFFLDFNWQTECNIVGSKIGYSLFPCTGGPYRV